jgi:hypothetical protein
MGVPWEVGIKFLEPFKLHSSNKWLSKNYMSVIVFRIVSASLNSQIVDTDCKKKNTFSLLK